MTEQRVEKILKEHEGWEVGYIKWLDWRLITAVGTERFLWKDANGCEYADKCESDWLVRPPAPKEKKPSERIDEIIPRILLQTSKMPSLEAKVLAIIAFLDEQHERAKK